MKLDYTGEQIERWRDKVHRRSPRRAVRTREQALQFVKEVGFCFAFKSENSELPCLLHAACGMREPPPAVHTHHDPFISFVWEMKDVLPAAHQIYYGKLLKKRPTMASLEFLPFFYVLSGGAGLADDYSRSFKHGRLSSAAKEIMDALADSSPQVTKGLKLATGRMGKRDRPEFDKAIAELQGKMFIVKVAEQYEPFSFVWAPFHKCFPAQIRKARSISPETARVNIMERYFRNQLIGTVASIQRLFGWDKQDIYHTLGQLVQQGIITTNIKVEGKDHRYYCLVERDDRKGRHD